jgi:hypothetical protein
MGEIQQAEKTLADLQAKCEALLERGKQLVQSRQELSFAAHTGDKKAKAQLDTVIAEIATHEQMVASVESAVAEAVGRVERVRELAAREQDKANAEKLLGLVGEVSETMIYIDRHLEHVIKGLGAVHGALEEIRALSGGHPSWMLVKSNAERAIKSAIQRLPAIWWRDWLVDLVPPLERRTFEQFWTRMAASLEGGVQRRSSEQPKKEREVA